jgi:hypothetical protein
MVSKIFTGEGKMSVIKALIPALVYTLLLSACCPYIVLPEEEDTSASAASKGWSAVVTNVGQSEAGDLRIDITLRNETADWSAMQAAANKPAALTNGDGKITNCDTVFVSTGGHRLAPGFQMRGFTAGTKAEPKIQPIYVECKGAEASPGSSLSIDYSYVTGEYNYYYPEENRVDSTLEVNLDQSATDLRYPIAEPVEALIQKPGAEITAINDVILTLTDVERTDNGLQFKWQTSNPGEYPSYVHIGNPPVIGEDGILYGFYETPDIVSVPISPAGDTAEWATEVAVPKDVKGLYIMLSVESKKQRLFVNNAIDVTDK